MTTNIVLLIVAGMLLIAAVFVYFGYLKIANSLYIRVVETPPPLKPGELKPSPYRIVRLYNQTNCKDFYYIYRGSTQHVNRRFETAKEAQDSMNELELLAGFIQTKLV
jgi:hypothetical protein